MPNYWVQFQIRQVAATLIGTASNPDAPWEWGTGEGKVMLQGELDPDPSLAFGGSVTNWHSKQLFGFPFFSMPLGPAVPNPSTVFDSLSGSTTNGSAPDGGVTVTALAAPLGIPVDGDGILEIQVFTLSDNFGATWKNVGLDAGPTTFIPLGPFGSGPYPTSNQGPIATIAGGPWTDMRADINFGLTGGGDVFSFNGARKCWSPFAELGRGPAHVDRCYVWRLRPPALVVARGLLLGRCLFRTYVSAYPVIYDALL